MSKKIKRGQTHVSLDVVSKGILRQTTFQILMQELGLPFPNNRRFEAGVSFAAAHLRAGSLTAAYRFITINDQESVPLQYYEDIRSRLRSIVPTCRGGDCHRAVYVSLAIKDLGMDPIELGTSREEVQQFLHRGHQQIIRDHLDVYRSGVHTVLPMLLALIEKGRTELNISLEELGVTPAEFDSMQRTRQ